MFRIICNNFLYIGHNIIYNYYLFLFCIFPTYFKDLVIKTKQTNDIYYNRMMFISFNDEIYNKYNIDIIDIHSNLIKMINNGNVNVIDNNNDNDNDNVNNNVNDNDNDTDDNSIISSDDNNDDNNDDSDNDSNDNDSDNDSDDDSNDTNDFFD